MTAQVYSAQIVSKVSLGSGGSTPLGGVFGSGVLVAALAHITLHLRVRNAERRSRRVSENGGSKMPKDRYGNQLLVNLTPAVWMTTFQPLSPPLIAHKA
jgi:hypothetical protein